MAASRQRLYLGNQRGYPCTLSRDLAIRLVQRNLNHFQVRAANKRPPSLEPIKLWHQRNAFACACDGRDVEHSVG